MGSWQLGRLPHSKTSKTVPRLQGQLQLRTLVPVVDLKFSRSAVEVRFLHRPNRQNSFPPSPTISHYVLGHSRWCKIASINSRILTDEKSTGASFRFSQFPPLP